MNSDEPKQLPLPIPGYTEQSDKRIQIVSANKLTEERLLRLVDAMQAAGPEAYNQRDVAIARTKFEDAFMRLNRAVLRPQRVKLPEDDNGGSTSSPE